MCSVSALYVTEYRQPSNKWILNVTITLLFLFEAGGKPPIPLLVFITCRTQQSFRDKNNVFLIFTQRSVYIKSWLPGA